MSTGTLVSAANVSSKPADSEDSSSSSSDEDSDKENETKPLDSKSSQSSKISRIVKAVQKSDSSLSSSENEEEKSDTKATPTSHKIEVKTPSTFPVASNKNKRKKMKDQTTPFRRVDDNVDVDPNLIDNSFEAKVNKS